jgi:septum formation protein
MVHPVLVPKYPVVLASGSPRRIELLGALFEHFEVIVSDVDEESLATPDPWESAQAIARAKAETVARSWPEAIVIAADTVVALLENVDENKWLQLAKPENQEDAERMLGILEGKRHAVITAVALISPEGRHEFSDTAYVTFRPLADEEIRAYAATGEPMGKAGAYAIQGGAGAFVARLDGNVSTVIGLPIEELETTLFELDWVRDPASPT